MGHLINDEAAKIAAELDPAKFASAPAAPTLSGRILEVSGSTVTLNIGSSKGVAVGQYFDVIQVHQIKDPDSGKMLTSTIPIGKIQITSVSSDTAVGKRVSGPPPLSTTSNRVIGCRATCTPRSSSATWRSRSTSTRRSSG